MRKRTPAEARDAPLMDSKLAKYGEEFLSMFDDAEERGDGVPHPVPLCSDSLEQEEEEKEELEILHASIHDMGKSETIDYIFNARKSASNCLTKEQRSPKRCTDYIKLDRKRFMSHKAAVITTDTVASLKESKKNASSEDVLSRQDFELMQREVNVFGASALDKNSKKVFNATMLAKIGVRAEKRPMMPLSIGLGLAKKKAERRGRAQEEAIASGMVQQKGLGKKKRREKSALLRKQGRLLEDGGAFRGGVMKVSKLK